LGLAAKAWSGVSAMLIDLKCNGEIEADIGARTARLSVMLEQIGRPVDIVCADLPRPHEAQGENAVAVLAPNTRAWIRGRGVSFIRQLVLDFQLSCLAGIVDNTIDLAAAFRTRLATGDDRLWGICRQFGDECASNEPANRLYGDGLAIALLGRLAALNSAPQKVAKGGLSPWQLRRVLDYLAENLSRDVPMRELADLIGLSQSHFSRAFKASTGSAPYQWLMQGRCKRAKQLLLEDRLGLAEIALDTGFSDQSHFTRVFVRSVGTSPGAWRRERLS
jgi:AraC family transcriptional regulator